MNRKRGFTIIELLLAMSFLSTLMLAVAMTVVRMGEMYNRGLTVKEVNIAGRSISSDIKRSISESQPIDLDLSAKQYVPQSWGGRLCVGKYSYIWNYGKTLSDKSANSSNSNIYSSSTDQIRLVKVPDGSGTYCTDLSKNIDPNGAVELLSAGDRGLALHNFSITNELSAKDDRSKQSIYYISYIVGTNDQAAIASNNASCKTPDSIDADLTYCSINEFNIVARSTNALQ